MSVGVHGLGLRESGIGIRQWSSRIRIPNPVSRIPSCVVYYLGAVAGFAVGVELLDDVGGDVETRSGQARPASGALKRSADPFRRDLLDDRLHLLHEVVVHFLLDLVDLGLRVLLEALALSLLALDFLLELRARRFIHHAAARLQLGLVVLQLLGLRRALGLFLLDDCLDAATAALPSVDC